MDKSRGLKIVFRLEGEGELVGSSFEVLES